MKTLFFVFLFLLSCGKQEKMDCKIKEIEIRYINWSIVRNTPIPVEAFWPKGKNPQISGINFILENDKDVIKNFEKMFDSINNIKEVQGFIDTRISCLIKYDQCPNDTLSFGRTNKMQYNSTIYKINKEYLELILPLLPLEQQKLIKSDLNIFD